MKPDWLFKLSAYIYLVDAACILLVLPLWTTLTAKPLDGTVLGAGILLVCICVFFGNRALKLHSAAFAARRNFAIYASIFCGIMGLAGWFSGIVFGMPLLIALLGMPEMWKLRRKKQEKI